LGGFNSASQIQDVYGISEETFLGIKDKLLIFSTVLSKLKINDANVEQLAKHPYINKNKHSQ